MRYRSLILQTSLHVNREESVSSSDPRSDAAAVRFLSLNLLL